MRITLFGYFPSDFWASFYGPDAVGRLECSFLGGPGTPPLVLKEAVRKALIAEPYDLCLPCRVWNYILIMTLHIRY